MYNIIEHTTFIYFSWRYLAINREHLQLKIHYPHLKSSGLTSEDCFHDAWKFNSLRKLSQINNMLSSMRAHHFTTVYKTTLFLRAPRPGYKLQLYSLDALVFFSTETAEKVNTVKSDRIPKSHHDNFILVCQHTKCFS